MYSFKLKPILFFTFFVNLLVFNTKVTYAQQTDISFVISMPDPANHLYHVEMNYKSVGAKEVALNMATWTPGFYELMDYAEAVTNFTVKNSSGKTLSWAKAGKNSWKIASASGKALKITYDVKAQNPFIGNAYLDEHYAYFIPGAVLMYIQSELQKPVTLQVKTYSKWEPKVVTGLNSVPGKAYTYHAANYDELYDSPFLMGELKEIASFSIQNIPHQFIGYNINNLNESGFTDDLKKIVENGSALVGEIPYKHYDFLGVGVPGRSGYAGIEHLNSSSLLIATGSGLADSDYKKVFYTFLAHEYFHAYNVKRIRPIELGPFDYSKENYTNLLWISEGFTDYYANLIVRAAGLKTDEEVLKSFSENISAYENKPGRLYESAAQASRNTWTEGGGNFNPRTPEQQAKSISYYDKGSAIGMLLDLKIRHETQNKYSLDDVMRKLYQQFYKKLKRGFTEKEFWATCEAIAGVKFDDINDYANTVKPLDYPKYLSYAGLAIDTNAKLLPGIYTGAKIEIRDTVATVRDVEWQSPAFKAGIISGDRIIEIDGYPVSRRALDSLTKNSKNGDSSKWKVVRNKQQQEVTLSLASKSEKSFVISKKPNTTMLEQKIYKSWMRQ